MLSLSKAYANDVKSDLALGLQALYNNTLTESQIQEKIVKTLETKAKYNQLVAGFDPSKVTWKTGGGGAFQEFQFASPIQIEGSKSNTVYGYLYTPNVSYDCNVKFPGTLLVHHVDDDISAQRKMALLAAQQSKGIIMIIYLPEYGPRKTGNDSKASPFNGNLDDFKRGIFQSLVDLRVSYQVLKRVPKVDTNQMQIGGLSLGAALTATMAGYDPVFKYHLIGLGGGDYGAIMTSYNNGKEAGGAIKWALQNVKSWKQEQVRELLYDIDAFTWAHNARNSKMLFLAAKDDEIFNYDNNVMKLANIYQTNGNDVRVKTHAGEHVPDKDDLGIKTTIKVYWRVLTTILDFLGDSKSAEVSACNAQYN